MKPSRFEFGPTGVSWTPGLSSSFLLIIVRIREPQKSHFFKIYSFKVEEYPETLMLQVLYTVQSSSMNNSIWLTNSL